MTRDEEARIIDEVLSGKPDAFEKLVLENQKNVYNLALKMTSSEQDAMDISQEAFIKAYTGLASFRGGSRFSVWLYRLTYNLCIDFLRKSRRAVVMSLSPCDDEGGEISVDIPDLRSMPETEYEKKELRHAVDEAVAELSPEHRQVVLLREVSGLSYSEIAEAVGINEGSVKSRLSRARRQLAKTLIANGTFCASERPKSRREDGSV